MVIMGAYLGFDGDSWSKRSEPRIWDRVNNLELNLNADNNNYALAA